METIYLNHAGTSWPKPQVVSDAVAAASTEDPTQWPVLFRDSIDIVANFFHVDPSRLVLTPSCTSALNLATMDRQWHAGDQVITSSFEHHALYRNLVKLRSLGVTTTEIPTSGASLFDLEFFESQLQKNKTKLVAVTAACNVTGGLLPIEEIVELSHRYDVKVLVDGAQIAGWMDLDLPHLGIDFFTFAAHKGLQAPWGIGGLYVSENSRMSCPSAACEIDAGPRKRFDSKPGYCDAGSVDLIALAGLAAGCEWLSSPMQSHRLNRARQNASNLASAIREIPEATLYHDFEKDKKMPSIAVSFGDNNPAISKRLKSNQIIASAGFQCGPLAHANLGTHENGIIRFSFGPAQEPIDIPRVVAALMGE